MDTKALEYESHDILALVTLHRDTEPSLPQHLFQVDVLTQLLQCVRRDHILQAW